MPALILLDHGPGTGTVPRLVRVVWHLGGCPPATLRARAAEVERGGE